MKGRLCFLKFRFFVVLEKTKINGMIPKSDGALNNVKIDTKEKYPIKDRGDFFSIKNKSTNR